MAALASTDVTVSITLDTGTGGKLKRSLMKPSKKVHDVTIAFGDGVKTYPTGGVPLPAFGNFGFYRQIDELIISDKDVQAGFVANWDKVNNKVKLFAETTVAVNQPLIEATVALAPAATVLRGTAIGW